MNESSVESDAGSSAAVMLTNSTLSFPSHWNSTLENLPKDPNFAWLLCALILAMVWIVYITYYNSRVIGFLLTKVINKFIHSGYIKIGSFSVSVLSGKVMFRDVAYITKDYSVRVQDGWLLFRYWKKYVKKSVTEDLSHSDTRLSMLLNGFELHLYNRSSVYSRLEQILGLDFCGACEEECELEAKDEQETQSESGPIQESHKSQWRDLIPVIKVEISSGRLVFGNRLLPTTLLIAVDEAHLVYTTKPAYNRFDQFMHTVKCRTENFKVILANSPKYTGMEDEPPRFMGEGFVVLQSNRVDLYYYMDEPGNVPEDPENIDSVDGITIRESASPVWGLDIKCGKGTDFSYGPWADRQRERLVKFFFPQDYQPLKATKIAQPGEKRQFQSFDIRLSTLADATVDMLFSKNKETMAVHMNIRKGSYLEITFPWVIGESGYTTKVNGQLLGVDASTSLQYRSLLESETLEFDVRVSYPLIWNDHQHWNCSVTGCKATANLIFQHKAFFQDLINDWSSKSQPDLLHFVPYTFHFNLILKEFEIILLSNEYNWIDCSSQHQENAHLAFCGELFDLSVDLPFTDFLPPTLLIKIWIQGECVDLVMYLPEVNTCRNIVTAIDQNCKLTKRNGTISRNADNEKKWRNKAKKINGWIDCWTVPIVALSISYTYHPVPIIVSTETDFDITTPEREELLLNPIRPPTGNGDVCLPEKRFRPQHFDPTVLPPDIVSLELEVGPSVLLLYGTLLSNLLHVKENYFGEYLKFSDLDTQNNNSQKSQSNILCEGSQEDTVSFDPRLYRPLDVTVSITIHDIQAHLMKNCKDDGPPCPSIYLERLGFELHKTYFETKLQLLLSPVVLSATDVVQRTNGHSHLKDGHLALSGLQIRGHAMFSDDGLAFDEETIEYAWLVEIQFGYFTGRLTAPHLHHIAMALETFVFLLEDAENALQSPSPSRLCHHGVMQLHCSDSKPDSFCPSIDDIKYRMMRISVESVNIYLVEAGTALNLLVHSIKVAMCNLHSHQTQSGITALIRSTYLRQFMMTMPSSSTVGQGSAPNSTMHTTSSSSSNDMWLEVGTFKLGSVYLDSIKAPCQSEIHVLQDAFLHKHDERARNLWFLWPPETCAVPSNLVGKCGCRGACNFFGSSGSNRGNRNLMKSDDQERRSGGSRYSSQSKSNAGDPGYGQSLLNKGQMLFDVVVPTYTSSLLVSPKVEDSRFMFTRGYMNQCTPSASRDISEQSLASISRSICTVTSSGTHTDAVQPHSVGSSDTVVSTSHSNVFLQLSQEDNAATALSSPVLCCATPPTVQRTLSHPESRLVDNEKKTLVSPSLQVSCSSSIASLSAEKGLHSEVNKRTSSHSSGHLRFHWRTSSVSSSRRPSCDSPTKDIRIPTSKSHSSPPNSHSGQDGIISTSGRIVHRATSVGSESVFSVDDYYPAEDILQVSTPEHSKTILDVSCHDQNTTSSNQSLLQTVIEIPPEQPDEKDSASSTSFISALSSQEDLALVDLHMQLNKPIMESPLLMFAYNSHMTKLVCSHWYQPPPLPYNAPHSLEMPKHQGCWSSQWIPNFHSLSEGFTSIAVIDKESSHYTCKPPPPPTYNLQPITNIYPWDFVQDVYEDLNHADEQDQASSCDSKVSKTTIVIKVNGDVNVCFSPLLLEASQRFIEAVTPTVSALHPLTIINHLHSYCVKSVQSANQLKKNKYMYVNLKEVRHSSDSNSGGKQPLPCSVYEETRTAQLKTFISVSKVNISILQASISEEMTSFSALDNIRDITCVSLLILSLSNLSGKVFSSIQSRQSIHTRPIANKITMQRRKGKESRSKKSKMDWDPPDPIAVETNEIQQEETIIGFDLQKVHTQLRRLKNSSSILKEATLTVIPNHRSKVFFAFEKQMMMPSSESQTDAFMMQDPGADLEDIMGFIMFECGIEGFSIKTMKRMGFESDASKDAVLQSKSNLDPSFSKDVLEHPENFSKGHKKNVSASPDDPPEAEPSKPSGTANSMESMKQNVLKDVFSCVVDLKTVWFNFAAPPQMPNTQKIDYTRLDWHLLSTATPAINSWLNPTSRLMIAVKNLIEGTDFRRVAVIACLMAEALDAQELHLPIQGRCGKFTPLAKTLREDPSCQLLTVLQRYMNISSLGVVEETLSSEFTPTLKTIHKGLVALARQWKNVLYMPSLVERNMKMHTNPKPFSVSFAVPVFENMNVKNSNIGMFAEENDITDEKIRLLNAEGGSVDTENSDDKQSKTLSDGGLSSTTGLGSRPELTEGDFSGSTNSKHSKKRLHCHHFPSTRASVAFPVVLSGSLDSYYAQPSGVISPVFYSQASTSNKHAYGDTKLNRNESTISLRSVSLSNNSIEANGLWNSPKHHLIVPEGASRAKSEDLYSWMARQQDYRKEPSKINDASYGPLIDKPVSKDNTLGSDDTKTSGSQIDLPQSSAFSLAPLAAQLADAHVIFNPLLTCLKVPSQIAVNSLGQKFGPNLAVQGTLDLFRIDIVESEALNRGMKNRKIHQTRFHINTSTDAAAFQCEKLVVEIDLREVQDLERAKSDLASSAPAGQQTLIYATVGGFQKHSTVAVNFCVNVNNVCQQVNLPLLRLLHQFFSMYQNARETQLELKESQLGYTCNNFRAHKKNDSSSGSETHTDGGKLVTTPLMESPTAGEQSPASSLLTKGPNPAATTTFLSRPQSFTQRLRASKRGYTNLERKESPLSTTLSDTGLPETGDISCTSDRTILDHIKERTPRCWRTMYYLLDLYATMPETKTITNKSPVVPHDISDGYKGNGKYEPLKEHRIDMDEAVSIRERTFSNERLRSLRKSLVVKERVPLVVLGIIRVKCTRLLATLSGLKLEAELSGLQASHTHKEKVQGSSKKWTEKSATGYLGQAMIVLLEGVLPSQQTVVKVNIGKSQALYSGHSKSTKEKNSALITIGPINVDIPQHPVALHGMMTRSSKQISTTLQELRVPRGPLRHSRPSDEGDVGSTKSPRPSVDMSMSLKPEPVPSQNQKLLQPIVVHFSIILDSLTIGASLLPSLRAQYQMGQVTSIGVTGSKAKFTIDLSKHSLSFVTKVTVISETNLPSSASVNLPPVHLSAEYVHQARNSQTETLDLKFVDGAVLRKGNYLNAVADLGAFEHSLTTDLLNHLVFVQKVFMKEINEVVQKMSGGDKPVRLWTGYDKSCSAAPTQLLYSIQLRLKGIQITATTPTNSAVRLETGVLELQLSNRVQNLCGSAGHNNNLAAKLFGKAHVELNVSLGQLLKDAMFEEADPEFQQVAYFKTRIALRNALKDEMVSSTADDKEAVLITLTRPLIYIQPVALDKAVLVWLNYKNAYEYWNEQRSSLNKEVLTATQQVFEKVPPISQLGGHGLSALFLQLTVNDMGICLPYTTVFTINRQTYDSELRAACVVTLENTQIAACSSGSLVSKGRFQGLCIRFADDFETSLDDWKPDPSDPSIMNFCVVSEGTYEVCSRTVAHQGPGNAKWILNVQWEMDGVDIHVDTNIGKHLSALANTLTSLASSQDSYEKGEENAIRIGDTLQDLPLGRKGSIYVEGLPDFVFDPKLDSKKRSRLIEQEMNEQVKIINDLRTLGASHSTIEQEARRLADLENLFSSDFKRDVMKKLRRQSMRQASSFKEKLGLSSKHSKPSILATPVPTPSPDRIIAKASLTPAELSPSTSSQNSSPGHGHTRTASLDSARVTFGSDTGMRHYGIDLALGEKWPSADAMDTNPLYAPVSLAGSNEDGDPRPSVGSSPATTTESSPLTTTTPSDLASDGELGRKTQSSPSPVYNSNGGTIEEESHFEIKAQGVQHGFMGASGMSSKQTVAEPNIDFELDVKVFINSGKCALHTKDFREEELRSQKGMGRERSFSSSTFEFPMSPGHRKRGSNVRTNASMTKLKFGPTPQAQTIDSTWFLIPGLDVKVHYNSHTEYTDGILAQATTVRFMPMEDSSVQESGGGQSGSLRRSGMKRASLFAWMTLQSIPEETVITPHILDFLEKALEPISIPLPQPKNQSTQDAVESSYDDTILASSMGASSAYAYASFPVDVIVYLRIQPSTLRFSCLPISRVECLLKLPSLDLVISTKRAEEELIGEFGETSFSLKPQFGLAEMYLTQAAVGGLSITASLSDFSVYIFHPYGGKKSGSSGSNKDLSGDASPLSGNSDRKDALSIQLEFVKVNISRSRKINLGLEQSIASQLKHGRSADHYGGAVIRFSTVCDIGSASFKYDMRRLTEILAFPKAWYRRTIVRRLFLGEQSTAVFGSDQEDSGSSADSSLSPESVSGNGETFNFSNLSLTSSTDPVVSAHDAPHTLMTQGIANRQKLTLQIPTLATRQHSEVSTPSSPRHPSKLLSSTLKDGSNDGHRSLSSQSTPVCANKSGSTWETLVLFAVNLSKLNIHMNMGNVMGNTIWMTRDLQSQGRLSIGSSGHKNMVISVGLGGSSLDSKGGIVGGIIELSQLDTSLHIREDPGQEPDHRIEVKLFALESRLDYMGTSVLMGRVSSLHVTLRDEWRVHSYQSGVEKDLPTKRPALIFIHGDLSWDQLQLMLSKSTTPDLIKMYTKLEEFFSQQFHSSKRVFSSLQPSVREQSRHGKRSHLLSRRLSANKSATRRHSRSSPGKKSISQDSSTDSQEPRHHRHWQPILSSASGLKLPTFVAPLPKHGTIVGGTMELHGNNISLACFHGINFRAKSWAVFSLKEPTISFATEAQDVVRSDNECVDTHIVQNLSFTLGHNITEHTRHFSMANVCRISRNFVFPPQFRTMQEWFHYCFATSELDEVDRFPGLERERRDSLTQERQPRHSPKGQDCNHTMEMIFQLPSLQLHLKTEHLQTQGTPGTEDGLDSASKPVVECSFITEFEDHIFVAVDAEAFFFLHDLITAYIKEKDRVGTPGGHVGKMEKNAEGQSAEHEHKYKVADPTETLQKDWRSYECKTWHLEPTVRLMSWAGKRIEPYGVDYILQKLGFSHARVTIPKWMQRGAMDPLDKLLSALMEKMVNALKEGENFKANECKK